MNEAAMNVIVDRGYDPVLAPDHSNAPFKNYWKTLYHKRF
jgi:hypothetical protein